MKKTRKIRLLAFILTLCMTIGVLPLYVFADEGEEIPEELQDRIVEEVPFEPEYLPGDLTFAECRTATLNMAEVPAVISQAQIEQYQHVNRLYEQEPDLYTVIFQNRDGSKTVYVFAQPVKSVSGNGAVTDMSATAIVSAHQPALPSQNAMMQSSLSQNVASILGMQERLDAYKAANDLKDYQMLDDVLETTTVNASAASVLVLNNSVSVASVSTTYSPLSGEYAIKLPNDTKYLTCINNSIVARSYVSVPYAKWLFEYCGGSQYLIQSLSKQGYYLAYVDGDSCGLEQWEDNDEGNEEIVWSVISNFNETGYTISLGGYALSENATMVSEGNEPVCQLTNHTTFVPLTSVSIGQTVIYANVDEYVYVPTIYTNPENASYAISDSDFAWYTTNDSMLTPDMDSFFALETGIAQIYCKHLYTGIESNRVTVIVSETPPAGEAITSGAVYLIRPNDGTNITLTMNIIEGETSLKLLNFSGEVTNTPRGITYQAWYNRTQAFSITSNGDGTYRISAIMSTSQYNAPNLYYNNIITSPYSGTYTLVDKNSEAVKNTLTMNTTGAAQLQSYNPNAQNKKWYLIYSNGSYNLINAANTNYKLAYANEAVITSTISANANWKITYFGVDLPSIKQTRSDYCGPTSFLQILTLKNPAKAVEICSSHFGFTNNDIGRYNLVKQQQSLTSASYIPIRSNGASIDEIVSCMQSMIDSRYIKKNAYGENDDLFTNDIKNTLSLGYPLICSINPEVKKGVFYYYNHNFTDVGDGHFICILGYDEKTKMVAISDCHYNDIYFGIHIIPVAELFKVKKNGLIVINHN